MNNNYLDTSFVDKAIIYATNCHKNVSRKEKNIPYIIHPLEVMAIAANLTDDKEILAAAVLHDVIEDTDATYEDLERDFSKRVADIVYSESYDSIPNHKNLSWIDKRQIAINNLKVASIDVKIVALSDKLSNIRQINRDFKNLGDTFWNRFHNNDPLVHKWRYYELIKCFSGLEDTLEFIEFKQLVEDTFKMVK